MQQQPPMSSAGLPPAPSATLSLSSTPLTSAAPPTTASSNAPATTETATAAAAAAVNAFASTKSSATQRKVAKLLDITTSNDIKDLASYVDEVLPGYFYAVDADTGKAKGDSEAASTSSNVSNPNTAPSGGSGRAITSTTLRSALDHRAIDMHKSFLQEFTAVYQNYQRVAAKVNELQEKCSGLEDALSTSTGGTASAADDFFYQIQMHQAELQLVQHHEKEVDEFRKQHHFGPAEQQALEEGPVDMNFLSALERAREVHRRSSELMQSQEYHQGAAAVMESTYAAISRAMEKIARHLLATAGTSSAAAAAAAGCVNVSAVATTGGGVGSIAADVPEVTGFQLRCVHLLYEESPLLHEKFLDEVARLRRASVLRRYFHLLTTGSANTASGMYQSGGRPRAEVDGVMMAGDAAAGAGMGARPLEAELNNPTYFFSSLCAWLHQTIVEEQDFLHTFFMNDEADTQANRRGSMQSATTSADAAALFSIDAERVQQDLVKQQTLLDSVFGGICKHICAALDNVLERLGRSASALGAAKGEGQSSGSGGATAGRDDSTAAATTTVDGANAASSAAPQKGPRGLTGGLTRLFMAATGRTPLGPFRRKASDESSVLWQRYATVTTRAQLEAVASSMLHAPLQGVQTCVTLVQLFEYYSVTTFTPLLGEGAALTRLIRETAPQQTREVFQRLLRVLAAHLLDSTAGVIHRTATLRRLASSNALNNTAAGAEDAAATAATSATSTHILKFLISMTYGEEADGVPSASLLGESRTNLSASASFSIAAGAASQPLSTSNANANFRQASDGQMQRHSAQDLKRVLVQLILPPSPEVTAYCSVLDAVLCDTARQADLLMAVVQQQQHAADATAVERTEGQRTDSPFHLHTEVKGFVRELLQALWRSAQSVQEDATLRAHLDDPCRAILQYNVLYELQHVMELHSDVLDLLCEATDSSRKAVGGEGDSADNDDMRQDLDTLHAQVGAAMNALRRQLLAHWEQAVADYFFPVSAEAVVAAALAPSSGSAASTTATSEAEEQHNVGLKKDVRRVLKQMANVYNTVASVGHLPEPVPLLPALCGGAKVRREVSTEITRNVVEHVYPVQFSALQRLPPNEELVAMQAEMSPQNLAVLVDFSSPATATP